MPWNKRVGPLGPLPGAIILTMWMGALAVPQTPTAASPAATPPSAQEVHSTVTSPPQLAPVVMIDAAHGGTESGAVLGPDNLEKDVTLAFARRLRQDLISRGLQAQLVRDGDTQLSTDQRASIANASRPSLYVCVHATSQGSGLRIYTAMPFGIADDNRRPFLSWQTAQASSLSRSRSLQQQLTAAIQKARFPIRSLAAPLRPLNNVEVPAVAIELAPTIGQVSQLASPDYQQMISAVLANAIAGLKGSLESGQ